jgi:hypothetical protein
VHPNENKEFYLFSDAATGKDDGSGSSGLGCCLMQKSDKGNKMTVVAYASRGLQPAERNYPPFLLEMRACEWAISHFHHILMGRKFTLFTDHKPLEKLNTKHEKALSRFQMMAMQYSFRLEYFKGTQNVVADFCSRNPPLVLRGGPEKTKEVYATKAGDFHHGINAVQFVDANTTDDGEVDYFELLGVPEKSFKQMQKLDPFCQALNEFFLKEKCSDRKYIQNIINAHCDKYIRDDKGIWWIKGMSHVNPGAVQLILPDILQQDIIDYSHASMTVGGHFGSFRTQMRVLQNFWFPGVCTAILKHIKHCDTCQRVKSSKITKLGQRNFPQETMPNRRMHLDTLGPLVADGGMKYILAMTCAFSKFTEVVALPNKEANTIAQAIFDQWILRYGCPHVIMSDGAPELIGKLQSRLYALLQIDKMKTTPHWPRCNGQVEVFNRTIGRYLRSFCDSRKINWVTYLPALMFCYNTGVSKATQISPFNLWYKFNPKMLFFDTHNPLARLYDESDEAVILKRLQTSKDLAIKNNLSFREAYSTLYDKKTGKAPDFKVDEEVMLHAPWLQTSVKNRKFKHPFIGPFRIIRLDMEKKIAEIKRRKQKFVVNLERIKKYFRPDKHSKFSCRHSPLTAGETTMKTPLTSSKYSAPTITEQNAHAQVFQAQPRVSARQKASVRAKETVGREGKRDSPNSPPIANCQKASVRAKETVGREEKRDSPNSPPIAMRTRLKTKSMAIDALKQCFACVFKKKEKAPAKICSTCAFYRQLETPSSFHRSKQKTC